MLPLRQDGWSLGCKARNWEIPAPLVVDSTETTSVAACDRFVPLGLSPHSRRTPALLAEFWNAALASFSLRRFWSLSCKFKKRHLCAMLNRVDLMFHRRSNQSAQSVMGDSESKALIWAPHPPKLPFRPLRSIRKNGLIRLIRRSIHERQLPCSGPSLNFL